jgi:DNA polymerase-4
MDAFYASVEQRDHPNLRGKPIVVGGRPNGRGVIATASYEARKFGLRSAMPSSRAVKLCPQVIFIRPRFDVYREVSVQIREIFLSYTELVEPLSLDEAYLDVTENTISQPSATLLAKEIRKRIKEETGLTASAGVSYNKFLAKIASDYNKPDGLTLIPPDKADAFIKQLPVGKFHGVGKVTEEKMQQLGIMTGEDLQQWKEWDLVQNFGKAGVYYYNIARGVDSREVKPTRVRKSVGAENTFHEDLTQRPQITAELRQISAKVHKRMAEKELKGKTITLKVRYHNFDTITRSATLTGFVNEEEVLYDTAIQLLKDTDSDERPVRLLGISVTNLDNQLKGITGIQLDLQFQKKSLLSFEPD